MTGDEARRVSITQAAIGICHMQVCAAKDATDDEILKVCNYENPSGTTRMGGRGFCGRMRSSWGPAAAAPLSARRIRNGCISWWRADSE